eukprot:scaffold57420_cov64-Phaeocystis_antarctica.AAC.8
MNMNMNMNMTCTPMHHVRLVGRLDARGAGTTAGALDLLLDLRLELLEGDVHQPASGVDGFRQLLRHLEAVERRRDLGRQLLVLVGQVGEGGDRVAAHLPQEIEEGEGRTSQPAPVVSEKSSRNLRSSSPIVARCSGSISRNTTELRIAATPACVAKGGHASTCMGRPSGRGTAMAPPKALVHTCQLLPALGTCAGVRRVGLLGENVGEDLDEDGRGHEGGQVDRGHLAEPSGARRACGGR